MESHYPPATDVPDTHQFLHHFHDAPQPSRLYSTGTEEPTRSAFFSYSPDVIKHRKRTSRSQRKVLEEAFRQNAKPSQYTRKLLMHQTGMERRAIQVWFQNRRAKEKKVIAKVKDVDEKPVHGLTDGPGLIAEDDEDCEDENEFQDQNYVDTVASHPQTVSNLAEFANDSGTNSFAQGTESENASDSATPSAIDASTPADTTTTGSTGSPATAHNMEPSPPIASSLRSYHSESNSTKRAATSPEMMYNSRRGSAPAPLSVNSRRPSPYVCVTADGQEGFSDRVAIWDGGTPPSPLSGGEDFVSLRRGSLPTFGDFNAPSASRNSSYLPSVPADPRIRRMSLERSRSRLAAHPYAWQVAAANGTYVGASNMTNPSGSRSSDAHTGTDADAAFGVPALSCIPTPAQLVQPPNAHLNYDHSRSHPLQSDALRPRIHSQLSFDSSVIQRNPRTYADIVPGPLPTPNFSFGTAPAPIAEVDVTEDDDTGTGTSFSVEDAHRFGSFASAVSTSSSVTSAWFSDVPNHELSCSQDFASPHGWQAEARRASCPAPFVSAFSDLHVATEANQILPSSLTEAVGSLNHYQHLPISRAGGLLAARDAGVRLRDSGSIAEHAAARQDLDSACELSEQPFNLYVDSPGFYSQPFASQTPSNKEGIQPVPTSQGFLTDVRQDHVTAENGQRRPGMHEILYPFY